MKRYRIHFRIVEEGYICMNACDEEEAKDALEDYSSHGYDMTKPFQHGSEVISYSHEEGPGIQITSAEEIALDHWNK
jgi:hypothetical protein